MSTTESIGALFVEDANFIHIYGGQLNGRAAIEASHRSIFDTIYKGSHAAFTLRSVRFVRPDVAIAFARAPLKFKEGKQTREIETRFPKFLPWPRLRPAWRFRAKPQLRFSAK